MRATYLILVLTMCLGAAAGESSLTAEQFASAMEVLKSDSPVKTRAFGAARLACELSPTQRESAEKALIEILTNRPEYKPQRELEQECLKTLTYHLVGADAYKKVQERVERSGNRSNELNDVLDVLASLGPRAKAMEKAVAPLLTHTSAEIRSRACQVLWVLDAKAAAERFKRVHLICYCNKPEAIDKEIVQLALNRLLSDKINERVEAEAVLRQARNIPKLDPGYGAAVEKAIRSTQEGVRLMGVKLVPHVGWTPEQQVERLGWALADHYQAVMALQQLSQLGEPARKLEMEILRLIGSERRDTSIEAMKATAALKLDALKAEAAVTAALNDQFRSDAAQMVVAMMGERGRVWRADSFAVPLTPAAIHVAGQNGNQDVLFRAIVSENPSLSAPALEHLKKIPPEKLEAKYFITLMKQNNTYNTYEVAKVALSNPVLASQLGVPLGEAIQKSYTDFRTNKNKPNGLRHLLPVARSLGSYSAPAANALAEVLVEYPDSNDALIALRKIGPQALPHIMDLVESPDERRSSVGLTALNSFGRGAVPALPRLIKWMDKEERGFSKRAVETILAMKLEPEEAGPVRAMLNSQSDEMRMAAERIVKRLPPPMTDENLKLLIALAREEKPMPYDKIEECKRYGARAAAPVAELLMDAHLVKRANGEKLSQALGKGMAPAKKELLNALKSEHESTRIAALWTLAAIADPTTLESMRALEKDPSLEVQRIARSALMSYGVHSEK